MEIGELVAVAVEAPHAKEGCPFCRRKEEVSKSNALDADQDEDAKPGNDTFNDSGTLATNLEARPQSSEVPAIPKKEKAPVLDMAMASAPGRTWHKRVYEAGQIPVLYGAHHLIPGNDAMKKSDLYTNKRLGPNDNGADAKNIGYNINSGNNGYWLPGNYAVRPWKGIDGEFQKAYAFLAMHDAKRQFHDAHKPFSEYIRNELNDLDKLVEHMEKKGCPVCKKGADKDEPNYHLNSRLNAISSHIMMSIGPALAEWKIPALTSSWCELYVEYVAENGEQAIEDLRSNPDVSAGSG